MISTSSYTVAGRHPDAVATSQGIPRWFRGRVYKALAPERWMITIGADGDATAEARFRTLYYEKILRPLDVHHVLADLGENAILLCWERPGEYCHRRLAAEWIEREAGVVVPEWPSAGTYSSRPRRRRDREARRTDKRSGRG